MRKSFRDSSTLDQYQTLGIMVREHISANWIETNERSRSNQINRPITYRLSFSWADCSAKPPQSRVREIVKEGLTELGICLEDIEEAEMDAGLGNGDWAGSRRAFGFTGFARPSRAWNGDSLQAWVFEQNRRRSSSRIA
ncbi:hypothetical protein PO124_17995 [Bacillus licheniformis]|nr:hypothetical protein [Bacillus licheniformis]